MIYVLPLAGIIIGLAIGGFGVYFVSRWRMDRYFQERYTNNKILSPDGKCYVRYTASGRGKSCS